MIQSCSLLLSRVTQSSHMLAPAPTPLHKNRYLDVRPLGDQLAAGVVVEEHLDRVHARAWLEDLGLDPDNGAHWGWAQVVCRDAETDVVALHQGHERR